MKGDITRDEVIGWDGKPLPPLPDRETFAKENPGAIMIRRGPLPENIRHAIENTLLTVNERETLTEDDKFALAYAAGARVSFDHLGRVKIEPPCGFERVGGKWHVAFISTPQPLNPSTAA